MYVNYNLIVNETSNNNNINLASDSKTMYTFDKHRRTNQRQVNRVDVYLIQNIENLVFLYTKMAFSNFISSKPKL